jgi:outer membrane lipoprotein-sorting protein
MAANRTGTAARVVAAGVAIAGLLGLGLLVARAGGGAEPELPPVSPEDLVSSVLAADPGPFAGTVERVNALGLPALPELPEAAADGTTTARVWSAGDGRGRMAVPSRGGERTVVADGTTVWVWNSAERTVVRRPVDNARGQQAEAADPTATATEALARLRPTSTVTVEGTAEVAGRPAYELVLAPLPTERTLLREVRIAVDAQERIPLRLTVLPVGSADPALQVGFTDLQFGDQDPALFTFTPPPGATVEEAPARDARDKDRRNVDGTTVGEGWDTVLVAQRDPAGEQRPELATLGTPVSGAWGSGRVIGTAVATAIVADDGRIAAGAVPEQVLAEALTG